MLHFTDITIGYKNDERIFYSRKIKHLDRYDNDKAVIY